MIKVLTASSTLVVQVIALSQGELSFENSEFLRMQPQDTASFSMESQDISIKLARSWAIFVLFKDRFNIMVILLPPKKSIKSVSSARNS